MPPSLQYRRDIDGLRAIAVLCVLAYHGNLGLVGGYVGVDVFFVISGYLITSLIQKEINAGTFGILEFWGRRARRIVPALVAMVAVTCVAGYLILLPADFQKLGQSVIAQSVMMANYYHWRESGYFAAPSELKPLLHMWSLAVEEQFYIVMAPLLVLLYRLSARFVVPAVLVALIASLCWSAITVEAQRQSAFYLLPSRAWEPLLGALLALQQHRLTMRPRIADLVGLCGLAAILYSLLHFDANTVFPGISALLPCLGAAAVIAAGGHETTVRRLLSQRPLVFIGLLSYSLYLWHWPALAYAKYVSIGEPPLWLRTVLLAASFLVAMASRQWIEIPFLGRRMFPSTRGVLSFSAGALLLLIAFGAHVHASSGLRDRFSAQALTYADARFDRNPRSHATDDLAVEKLKEYGLPRLGDLNDRRPPVLLVLGDSHANALMPAIEDLCHKYGVPAVGVTRPATAPLLFSGPRDSPETRAFRTFMRQTVASLPSLQHVLLIARWHAYPKNRLTIADLDSSLRYLHTRKIRVWIVRQVPEPMADVPRMLALSVDRRVSMQGGLGMPWEQYTRKRAREDVLLSGVSSATPTSIDPGPWFYITGSRSRVELAGRALFVDDDHLSSYGAFALRPLLAPMIQEVAASARAPASR
jgi:peptidoglycan/LPS O-acetylase OafA/YrhL